MSTSQQLNRGWKRLRWQKQKSLYLSDHVWSLPCLSIPELPRSWRTRPFPQTWVVFKIFTADFQSKIFIPSISPNFNSFSERNTKISEDGEIHTAGKISHSRRWGYQVSKSWLWGWCCRCWMLKLISMLMTDLMPLLTLAIKMICILFFPEYPKYQKWHIYTRLKNTQTNI